MRTALLLATFFAAAGANPLAATTINFETAPNGSPTVPYTAVGDTYASLGITFTDAVFKQCFGGCPPPDHGTFVSSADYHAAIAVSFGAPIDELSFVNVNESSFVATGYDALGDVIATTSGYDYERIGSYRLAASGLVRVVFESMAGAQPGFGIDDLQFGASGSSVPEPASWAMMATGFLLVGTALPRRQAWRAFVSKA